jgi:serine/threonine protein phosphatase PrpC
VTSQPDITEQPLQDDDEFVIVASDGLWDVMDSQEVVRLARRDLHRRQTPQVGMQGAGCHVSRVLTRALALVAAGKTRWC